MLIDNKNIIRNKDDEPNRGIGECLKIKNQYEQALQWFHKALKINPINIQYQKEIKMMNRFEEALEWYQK
ncbi:unnamed protein product [Paramecium pentaurelia]|uniref:Tetratricopeptide repeat protein n=1 Tax=Paramecium pentaurelia TaxID=43138 RepID=A0A8S1VL82_9CILI|nr:unnamed protein product [Paramecium pentaurelia]